MLASPCFSTRIHTCTSTQQLKRILLEGVAVTKRGFATTKLEGETRSAAIAKLSQGLSPFVWEDVRFFAKVVCLCFEPKKKERACCCD